MQNNTESKPYPYTPEQLQYFLKEIQNAGGVDELMLHKKALKKSGESTMIAKYKDIEAYKEKFITGVYESLKPYYNTEVPYVFWSLMFDALKKSKINDI
jgi:hypothetical protein